MFIYIFKIFVYIEENYFSILNNLFIFYDGDVEYIIIFMFIIKNVI